jgi:hypothetical protein
MVGNVRWLKSSMCNNHCWGALTIFLELLDPFFPKDLNNLFSFLIIHTSQNMLPLSLSNIIVYTFHNVVDLILG